MTFSVKTQIALIFGFVTFLFVYSRLLLFNGFNGTDDLHYAMLAAKLLKGEYNPFERNDIFSGRILLISLQALIYKIGGISLITTGIGTVMAVIISCWLVVYKMLDKMTPGSTFLACSLFYFNPALTESTKGILPDAYIMLSGILVYLLINPHTRKNPPTISNNIIAGVIIALTLLVKETILVFLPFAGLLQVFYNGRKGLYSFFFLVLGFFSMIVAFGFCYHYFAGDAFFKLIQIRNSVYPNPCNFDTLPLKDFVVRLTYGVYVEFIVTGFYPVVLGFILLIARLYNWQRVNVQRDHYLISFCSLLLIGLYFPFSLDGYQPLCSSSRQFLFLTPFAIPFLVRFLFLEKNKIITSTFLFGLVITILICIANTGNKWQLMIYILMFLSFSIWLLFNQPASVIKSTLFSLVLFVSIFEIKFFKRSHSFWDLYDLSDKLHSQYYYFPDHDNMMHWKLFHRFDETNEHYINLEKDPFPIFKVYYERADQNAFHPGWFIVNKINTVLPVRTLKRLDSIQNKWPQLNQIKAGGVDATFIVDKDQLLELESILKKLK